MKFHSSIAMTVVGAAFLAFAAAPPAFAKTKDSGTATVPCLTADSALQSALGLSAGAAPVTVTLSPTSLWPPNHKMRAENISVNLNGLFASTPPAPYGSGADISVWLVNMTDDQVTSDGPTSGGGHSCGAKSATQGADWSPGTLLSTDPTTYVSGSTASPLTDMTVTPLNFVDQSSNPVNVGLRAERCARDGTRTYTVSVVCCDTTDLTKIVCDDAALATTPPTVPTTTDDLQVEVLKSRRHHGKP